MLGGFWDAACRVLDLTDFRLSVGLLVCLSGHKDVRAQCDAAQMAMFTALQSEYLLQLTRLADPTGEANGAVGQTNSL